jgi:hypothetical protein
VDTASFADSNRLLSARSIPSLPRRRIALIRRSDSAESRRPGRVGVRFGRKLVERVGREVGTVRPDDRSARWVQGRAREIGRIAQGIEDRPLEQRANVCLLCNSQRSARLSLVSHHLSCKTSLMEPQTTHTPSPDDTSPPVPVISEYIGVRPGYYLGEPHIVGHRIVEDMKARTPPSKLQTLL